MNTIKKWHRGKILLLWIWGLVISGFSLHLLRSDENIVSGFILIIIIIGLPIVLSVITWKWLGGQEDN